MRTYGVVGQVEPVQANIRDEASTRRAIAGAAAVVNCVGILVESGKQGFEAVQAEGAGRIARIAAEEGVERLVHVSAIGADPDSDSLYGRSKAAGRGGGAGGLPERRSSCGPRSCSASRTSSSTASREWRGLSPVLPVVGPETRFQPVYVDDVAAAVEAAATRPVEPGIYELGGPEVASFRELMSGCSRSSAAAGMIVALPMGLARAQAWAVRHWRSG